MEFKELFDISLKRPICIEGISEDSVRELVNALEIDVDDNGSFTGFVTTNNGVQVKFNFDSTGNFSGVTAKLNGKNINLINGYNSSELQVFKGPPTATNPGSGWQTEPVLTKQYLNQPDNENNWEIFYASRVAVLNNV